MSPMQYLRIYKKNGDVLKIATSDIVSITFSNPQIKLEDGIYIVDGHRFVDLGLPSGLLWAETNIGAAKGADCGVFFAWGENTAKQTFHWDTYRWITHDKNAKVENSLTKYCCADEKLRLDKEDDSAYVNWGSSCRMPTKEDFDELNDPMNCVWKWTAKIDSYGNPTYGYEVKSKKNGNLIFLPSTDSTGMCNKPSGMYWTNTIQQHQLKDGFATTLEFWEKYHGWLNRERKTGCCVRPVSNL